MTNIGSPNFDIGGGRFDWMGRKIVSLLLSTAAVVSLCVALYHWHLNTSAPLQGLLHFLPSAVLFVILALVNAWAEIAQSVQFMYSIDPAALLILVVAFSLAALSLLATTAELGGEMMEWAMKVLFFALGLEAGKRRQKKAAEESNS